MISQASFNAEDHMEGVHNDETKDQRINQLETLLQEYKSINEQLGESLDALGGKPSSVNLAQSEKISAELEKERLEKASLQKSGPIFFIITLSLSDPHISRSRQSRR